MRNLASFLAIITVLACSKQQPHPVNESTAMSLQSQSSIQATDSSQMAYIQSIVSQFNPDEVVSGIDSIPVIWSGRTEYVIAYYYSNLGGSNVLISREYTADGTLLATKTTKCTGNCGCLVEVIITSQRSVEMRCSCASCSMVTN
jgi:hypothetical protein